MFERFTERARMSIIHAQDFVRELHHGETDTDHMLVGLMREGEGIGARVLNSSLGLAENEGLKALVAKAHEIHENMVVGQIQFTPDAKKVFDGALREALAMGHGYIGTEHLLLALLRDPEFESVKLLARYSIKPGVVREEVRRLLGRPTADRLAEAVTLEASKEFLRGIRIGASPSTDIYQRGWNDGYEARKREERRER